MDRREVRQEMVAMLSIEARATEFALEEIRCGSVEELELWGTEVAKKAFEEIRSDYIRIATEQREIDVERAQKLGTGKLNALLQTETAEETIKKQALLLDGLIAAEEKPEWKAKAKSLLDRANQLKAYDNEGEQEWFEDVVAFLEELSK